MKQRITIMAIIAVFVMAFCLGEIINAKQPGGQPSIKSVKVTPVKVKVKTDKTKKFKAVVKAKGGADKSVSWYVNDVLGGDSSVGTITQSNPAVYTAPAAPPNPATVTIKAVSTSDTLKYATSKVKIELSTKKKAKIKGVAATGAPIANGTVVITDATGKEVGTDETSADGSYSVNYQKKYQLPFLIKVTSEDGTVTLYSVTNDPTQPANITPFTDKAVETLVVQNGGDVSDGEVEDDIEELAGQTADMDSAISKALETIKNALGLSTVDINFVTSKLDTEDPDDFYDDLLDAVESSIEDAGKDDIDDLIEVDDDYIKVDKTITLKYGEYGVKTDDGEELEDESPEDLSEDEQPEIEGTISAVDPISMTITVNSNTIGVTDTTVIKMEDIDGNDTVVTFSALAEGQFVKIEAKFEGDLLVAAKIKIKNESEDDDEDEFEAAITQKNDEASTIVVDNALIYVTVDTVIDINDTSGAFSDLAVGQEVEVKTQLVDFKLVAVKIEVKDEDSN
ncbi:MAG: hypothetical protein HZA77_03000 [Candidatus Schekmanbacteria bacterium]|nr:hypothetical protein [Candidatus Schekmanbacteria bacterium]